MNAQEDRPKGPRGGRTTRTEGFIRKTFWITVEAAQALKKEARSRDVPEAQVIRELLDAHYDLGEE